MRLPSLKTVWIFALLSVLLALGVRFATHGLALRPPEGNVASAVEGARLRHQAAERLALIARSEAEEAAYRSPLRSLIGVPCTPGQHCVPTRCVSGLSPSTPWPFHTIVGGQDGADGINRMTDTGGFTWLVFPNEQAGTTSIARKPSGSNAQKMWPSAQVITGVPAPEDAIWADIDQDGYQDVVTFGQNNTFSIRVSFAPTSYSLATYLNIANWTSISITAASGVDSWITGATADMDGDGDLEIIGGGRSQSPSSIRIFTNPGGATARTAGSWTTTGSIGNMGWAMSLIPMNVDGDGDIDLVISDRQDSLRGSRWLRNDGGGVWTNQTIFVPASGEEAKFLTIADVRGTSALDIILVVSGTTYDRIFISENLGGWTSWSTVELAAVSDVGDGVGTDICDIDGDAQMDMVVTYGDCTPPDACLVWLTGPAFTTRNLISLGDHEKLDRPMCFDIDDDGDNDVATTSQREGLLSNTLQQGSVWHENCR